MQFRYSIATLLYATVVVSFFLWIVTVEGGPLLLAVIGFFGCIVLGLCGLIWVFSYLMGTPGERQHKSKVLDQNIPDSSISNE